MENEKLLHIRSILKQFWGYDSFRPLQEDIILSVLEGKDTLALLPTGGGKSICFQVPAMALGGLCVVISPLIALMKDQVQHLREKGIKAAALYSGMSSQQIDDVISNVLFDPEYRFLYISPERLQTHTFQVNFQRMPVKMIAVDEAHCISQWGYDFRPPYLEIAKARKLFPEAPVLALTATATPEVVKDIQYRLAFKKENVFQKSFKRGNLTYFVVKEEDKYGRMLRIMQRYPGTGIVYVRNRRKTAEVADFLKKNGIPADFYHAGLDARTRDERQNAWMTGKIRVIVATNAFGMGIDKPDVRFVVHIDLPDTLEAYFQEAGRGGRDEKEAVAILLYDQNDLRQLQRSFTLAFPPLDAVRKVYYQLCQHYYVQMGQGQGAMYPFYLGEHAREMQMDATQYFNALKLLEQAGVILLSEHLRECSQVHFKMDDRQVRAYEERFPENSDFIKLLLRSYAGLFTQYVDVDERVLAQRAGMTEDGVVEMLQLLKNNQVISYQPKSEIPLIIFTQNRIDERYIYFEPRLYDQRKAKAEERMQAVKHYVTSTNVCRSQLLLAYFGETDSTPCGGCDVCLKTRNGNAKQLDVKMLTKEVQLLYVKYGQNSDKQIFEHLSQKYDEDDVVQVMRWVKDFKK